MDFDLAERKLKTDHDRLRSQVLNRNAARSLSSNNELSKAKKIEMYRRREFDIKKQERELEKKKMLYAKSGFESIERKLGVERNLRNVDSALFLEAVSVHGHGDKITLPPSVLGTLAERDLIGISQQTGQPLFFRLGIRRHGYEFPQSDAMKNIMDRFQQNNKITSSSIESSSEDDEDTEDQEWENAYNDELKHEYVSYTYATVIEFSQEEGFVGLPVSAANALLKSRRDETILSKVTQDPASSKIENDLEHEAEFKTPGHPAHGLFPVPASEIEITLLKKLPLGTRCTLEPSKSSIKSGFYGLVDVKHVLEQSLIRTRGCLNVGDIMHCWFRGKRFDLSVQDVLPRSLGAISCVNCDIEVDISPMNDSDMQNEGQTIDSDNNQSKMHGYRLCDPPTSKNHDSGQSITNENLSIALPLEPPIEQVDGVITIHIKGEGKSSKRRFNSSDPFNTLFDFAIVDGLSTLEARFRLVTRYPRRVFEREENLENMISDLNLSSNELLLIEKY